MSVASRVKRPAWQYTRRPRPGLRALLGSRDERRLFLRAWLMEPVSYALDLVVHFALKLLPVDACSAVGAFLGRVVIPYQDKEMAAQIRQNLAALFPDLPVDVREQLLRTNCENRGRFMTEFSVLPRICRAKERIRVSGIAPLSEAAKQHPIILVALHLGNWEILSRVGEQYGIPFHTLYRPNNNPVRAWITERTRTQLAARLLPVGMSAARPALKILKAGGIVALFCDEGFNRRIRGPLFGRPAHLRGNLGLAARLARHTGAVLCIVHCERLQGANFHCHIGPLATLPEHGLAIHESNLLDDVRFLNELIEPIVTRHIDQWYCLDDKLELMPENHHEPANQ